MLTDRLAASEAKTDLGVIDCDVHTSMPSAATLRSYLPEEWKAHSEGFGAHGYSSSGYPRRMAAAARLDSWPPSGQVPGSDLPFMAQQHLDPYNISYAILGPLESSQDLNADYATAVCRAVNDWTTREWLDVDARLRGSIILPFEEPVEAVAEIERIAQDPRFVQLYTRITSAAPLGNRKYWPIYEAAERHGLPVGIHFGGNAGNPHTGAGWPSFYLEDHVGNSQTFQSQVISFVCEGVFERYPDLKVVLIEGGVAWLPSLAWRLDRAFETYRAELPHLSRLPSEYIADNIWLTTQPIEEPAIPTDLRSMIESFPALQDRLLFSSDYPHWDFDAPDLVLRKAQLPPELEDKIMFHNAAQLYGLADSVR